MCSNIQSLNNSFREIDDEKIEKMHEEFGYEVEYVTEQLLDDQLNHATTTYHLLDQQKEF